MEPNYVMKGRVKRVIDGDTVVMDVSPAFNIWLVDYRFRLYGIDTYEMNSKDPEERMLAVQAKGYVIDKILGQEVMVHSIKNSKGFESIDSFGRYLVEIIYKEDRVTVGEVINLNQELVRMGLASTW